MQLNIIFWMACFKWCIFNTAGRNILDNLTPFTNYNKIFFKQYTFTFGHVATGTRVYVFEGGKGGGFLKTDNYSYVDIYRKVILSDFSDFSDDIKLIGIVHI